MLFEGRMITVGDTGLIPVQGTKIPHAMQQLSPWLQLLRPSPITKTRNNQMNKCFLKLNYIWEHTTSCLTWEAHMSYFGHNTVFYLIFLNECSSLCEIGIPVSEGLCILLLFSYTITLWTLSCNVCSISLSILQWAMAGVPQEMKKLHVVVTLAASAIFSLRKNLRTQPIIIRQEVHFERITTREPPVLTPSWPIYI